MTFHLIPHTHWDIEWYLPRAAFRARLVPVLDEVIEQLEQDPAARFLLDGQTILLEDYLAARPENADRIAALVTRGMLEIGPWYVLSDLLIPSAESLRRNLQEGTEHAARFGKRMNVLYSPDAFGHPAGLPKLAAEFGITRAVVRRGLGLPGDFYRWEAASGESLLVHHLPKGGYDFAIDLAGENADLATFWPPIRAELLERAQTTEIAVFLGADHHAMVRNVSGLCARLQALEHEHSVRVSSLTEFFDAVERTNPVVPVIRGELRRGGGHTWILQDVLSSRSRLKRMHAKAEWELSRVAEPLANLAERTVPTDRKGLLRVAWRTLLESQFHDTLAGTTCDEAQCEQETRLSSVEALAKEIAEKSLADLIGHDPDVARDNPDLVSPKLVLWNPSAFAIDSIVTAEVTFFDRDVLVGPPSGREPREGAGYHPFVLIGSGGQTIPVQVISRSKGQERLDSMRHYPDQDVVDKVWIAFHAPKLASQEFCLLTPRVETATPPDEGLTVSEWRLANKFVSVEIANDGCVALSDLRSGEHYSGILELTHVRDEGDLYTFSPGQSPVDPESGPVTHEIVSRGPLVGAIESNWRIKLNGVGTVSVRRVITLCADSCALRVSFDVMNAGQGHRLRVRIPVGCIGATAGAAFGVERRAPVQVNPHPGEIEREVATAPAHRFVASATGGRGLLVTSPSCFEYEATETGDLLVTLLRSVGELAKADLRERPGRAAWPMATPLALEQESHRIELALHPINQVALDNEETLGRLADEAILPIVSVFIRNFAVKS